MTLTAARITDISPSSHQHLRSTSTKLYSTVTGSHDSLRNIETASCRN